MNNLSRGSEHMEVLSQTHYLWGYLISDVTILFNSFTHIYLVFCLCFIYKMHWYSLFYVLKALLDETLKKK